MNTVNTRFVTRGLSVARQSRTSKMVFNYTRANRIEDALIARIDRERAARVSR